MDKQEKALLGLPMTRGEEAERAARRFCGKYPLAEGTLKAIGVSPDSAAHYREGFFLRGAEWADKVYQCIDDNLERYVLEGRNWNTGATLTDDLRRKMLN